MAITANPGPLVSFGLTQSASGAVGEYNDQRAPSGFDLGSGLTDPRQPYAYAPGNGPSSPVLMFWDNIGVVDQIPTTISSNCIANAQAPTANTALTLVSATNANITVGVSVTAPENGATVSGLLAIDSSMGTLAFGSAGTMQVWNPARAISRGVVINLSSNLDGGTFTVAGRDVYGYKVTEQLTAGTTQLKSKKAYKYISAINASTTITSTGVTVGVQDLFGFPLRCDNAGYLSIVVGNSSAQAFVSAPSSNCTFASTATATATTGDVRGTWLSSVASSTAAPAVRLYMSVSPSAQNLQAITASDVSGLFGVAQFSSV